MGKACVSDLQRRRDCNADHGVAQGVFMDYAFLTMK